MQPLPRGVTDAYITASAPLSRLTSATTVADVYEEYQRRVKPHLAEVQRLRGMKEQVRTWQTTAMESAYLDRRKIVEGVEAAARLLQANGGSARSAADCTRKACELLHAYRLERGWKGLLEGVRHGIPGVTTAAVNPAAASGAVPGS